VRAVSAVLASLLCLAACGDNIGGNISVRAPAAWAAVFDDFVALTDRPGLAIGDGGEFHIEVVEDAALPPEGYRIDRAAGDGDTVGWTVSASDVLGAQYGVAAALENLGFRFRHPFDTYAPREPADRGAEVGIVHAPQVRVRGLQLHTLHPIEGYFAFWEPSAGSTNDAHRIIDWLVKNRGNYLQWVALDNIMDPAQYEPWQVFTRELIDYAHARGVRVGLNIQLFGKSNLQLAFDLSDDDTVPLADSVAQRLPLFVMVLPFDVYDLSFGEFFNSEPQKFIDSTNEVARQLREQAPASEMHAVVHVGATQRVQYMDRDLLYYFLVQYADPTIIPDIHTVMFYNLVDDAGGAYQHDNFDEHRDYLVDRMCAGQRVAYFPETAYWVAFDDSVPMYLPLYVYSRWTDLRYLADAAAVPGCSPLDEHLLFSTGWEWGYWLNDVASLHASYELPATPQDLIADAYAPDLGDQGARFVAKLMDAQKQALIDQRLIGYLVGRDVAIDAGDMLDPPIISQPDRITFDDVVADPTLEPELKAKLALLEQYVQTLESLEDELGRLELPNSRWSREIADGVALDRMRARFVLASYRTVLAHLDGTSDPGEAELAESLLAEARARVAARHADLHDTHRRRLVDKTPNHTFYQFGYLYMADTLCYWQREHDQVAAALGDSSIVPNSCLF
jgi:hypothetical protein